MRDQRIFLANKIRLNILSEDSTESLCVIDLQNIIEALFYLQSGSTSYKEKLTIVQPDVLIRDVQFGEGNQILQ